MDKSKKQFLSPGLPYTLNPGPVRLRNLPTIGVRTSFQGGVQQRVAVQPFTVFGDQRNGDHVSGVRFETGNAGNASAVLRHFATNGFVQHGFYIVHKKGLLFGLK